MNYQLKSAESVTEGHPDKVCDQIADAVLDAILEKDPMARVACECIATRGMVNVIGEITTDCYVDIPGVARRTILDIGYDRAEYGFDGETCAVLTAIDGQSPDISQGVNHAYDDANDQGAGDQGLMFGFATDETPEHMPLALMLSHRLCRALAKARKKNTLPFLRPDGKGQVTLAYTPEGKINHIASVVLSTQHDPDIAIEDLREAVLREVILPNLPQELLSCPGRASGRAGGNSAEFSPVDIYINPTGRFVVGGPRGDSGLTGRKLIVDTYGGFCRHGGGSFSGKDPTKVDRSASYAARHVARNLVASGAAKRCEVALAYAIGVAKPLQITVDSFGTGFVSDDKLGEIVTKLFDLRPAAIIERFDLRRPIYRPTAAYGHFGRGEELGLPWERCDFVGEIQKHI
ncbi:MAG: methionine adenosyltransferase [Clostridia bacterium]|nr:methionine adenosyltransferase [Clostridia bacterium]